ncbi:MAG: hypothetical protein LAP40_05090 [Acidobacteriia bacterium]|nr:hypothetical protein [Terriglobia bacterium]
MAHSVPMIGLRTEELPWIRLLVTLLRHPDPTVPELARQALLYLSHASDTAHPPKPETREAL